MGRFTPEEQAALVRRTLRHYDENAESFWEGTRDHDVSQNRDAFLRALAKAPARILDLGCGPGRDLAFFRSLGHDVVGLDGSARFCEMAREHGGVEVLRADFLALAPVLRGRRFDGIFANASLFHVPTSELPRVLGELRAALAPRGVLFTSNPRGRDVEGFSGERFGAFHTEGTWCRMVEEARFVAIESYYRPPGRPRDEQPWFASVWRRAPVDAREAFEAGARLFDAGRFWDAHEAWEERWREEPDEVERRTFQGLIQIAAALHKLTATPVPDAASAGRLFERGLAKLDGASLAGVDLASFRAAVRGFAAAVGRGSSSAERIPRLADTGGEPPRR